MKVIQPITVNNSNIISSNLFDVPMGTYFSGTTFGLGAYAAVAGGVGYQMYKSLQAGNIGNDPATSPLWWEYSSDVYIVYSQGTSYPLGAIVYDSATKTLWESLTENNTNVLDPVATVPWFNIGTNASTLPSTWSSGTTYAVGDTVYLTLSTLGGTFGQANTVIKNIVATSLQAGNSNHAPNILADTAYWQLTPTFPVPWIDTVGYGIGRVVYTADTNLWQTSYGVKGVLPALTYSSTWLYLQPSNTIAAFDSQTSTVSKANKEITFTVATGIIDTVGLIGVNADLAVITVRNGLGGTIVYEKTLGLTGGNPTNAWDYYFSEPTFRVTQTIVEDIPPFINSHVTVTLTGSGIISIGNLIFGKSKEIGVAEYGVSSGILDFSTKTTDSFGKTTFVRRGYKKRVNCRAFIDNSQLNTIQNNLYAIRATPCLWILSSDTRFSEALVVYGFYKDFTTDIPYPTTSYINIEIEGLI